MLFLHVGMHKTGTTTIQNFLSANTGLLQKYGYDYPAVGRGAAPAHHMLAKQIFVPDEFDGSYGGLEEFSDFFSTTKSNVVLSSEIFSSFKTRHIDQLRRYLPVGDLEVIFYVRHQAEFVQSAYFQKLKSGEYVGDFDDFFEWMLRSGRLNYYTLYKAWSALEGAKVTVRVFEKEQLIKEDLLLDFLETVGLGSILDDSDVKIPGDANVSPSPSMLVIAKELQRLIKECPGDKRVDSMLWRQVLDLSEKVSWPREKLNLVDERKMQRLMEAGVRDNNKLAMDALGRENGSLFTREPVAGCDSMPTIDMVPADSIISLLLVTLRAMGTLQVSRRNQVREQVRK